MIIGEEFVWAHLGKAGGEMTHTLFMLFPDLVRFADSVHSPEQHTAFSDREEEVDGKLRVLNIRRLPTWMLSFHMWKSTEGLHPDYRTSAMPSPYEMAQSSVADQFLGRYVPPSGPRIDYWLRSEHLIEDFTTFIAGHTDLSPASLQAIKDAPRVNDTHYDKSIDHWFTPAHVALMYIRNPWWAEVEASAYGDGA